MKLEELKQVFDDLYEDYTRDLSGWSMMNTDLGSRKHRDEYYYNRTFQLCLDFKRLTEIRINTEKDFLLF